jgi:inhibitor of Bruton tyrosine kinase
MEIHSISSGGNTIAAATGRGDLFTMTLNKVESNSRSDTQTSTTNPSKIRGAVTQPQCIWTARKDGVRSFGVSEHGSVIISTHSGAVWRRIKRSKAKDAFAVGAETRRKDYKFQRIPHITNVVTVRSSAFGAFCAIRKDSDVMRQVTVRPAELLEDVSGLICLQGFQASEPDKDDKDCLRFSRPDLARARIGPEAYEILRSPDLDTDLQRHLTSLSYSTAAYDAALSTSASPGIAIPVHAWILAARSSTLASCLKKFKCDNDRCQAEEFRIEQLDGRTTVTFTGLDLLSILNIALFCYCDKIIPAWEFGRQAPALAHRYRHVRTELMRTASRLKMLELEAAVRIQTLPKPTMAKDFAIAIRDRSYFDGDGDVIVQLDGAEIALHSALVRQRCPWFEGLFHGRSGGLWLAQRRQDDTERVRVDLQHIDPHTFRYVMEYLYADSGPEMFDKAVMDFEDFVDLVMDVLHAADELLLDRLSEICQQVLGRYVNTRNIAHMLNEVSPYTITKFKEAGLEYICLQTENLLENHLLDDLDEDLLLELDQVTRENQTARHPVVRSGRADLLLHERYPDLAGDIDEERQRRVREMAYRARHKDDERKLSSSLKASSYKGRAASLEDTLAMSRTPDRTRRQSSGRNAPFSPDLRPKDSRVDLMFEMEEGEESSALNNTLATPSGNISTDLAIEPLQLSEATSQRVTRGGRNIEASPDPGMSSPPMSSPPIPPATSPHPSPSALSPSSPATRSPWARSAALPTAKLDLRQIMSESSKPAPSALSAGLAAQGSKPAASRPTTSKVSQKERKKQQQEQAVQAVIAKAEPQIPWQEVPTRPAPWQRTPSAPKTSLKDALSAAAPKSAPPIAPSNKPLIAAESSAKASPRRTASPDTRFSGQSRTSSYTGRPNQQSPMAGPSRPSPRASSSNENTPLVPHSKSYIAPRSQAESTLGLSIDDIIRREQRERDIVKEAVAKRSLQEIQQEQEFQEWWDQESRRTQEEEGRKAARQAGRGKDSSQRGGRAKGRGGRGRGRGGKGQSVEAGETSRASGAGA